MKIKKMIVPAIAIACMLSAVGCDRDKTVKKQRETSEQKTTDQRTKDIKRPVNTSTSQNEKPDITVNQDQKSSTTESVKDTKATTQTTTETPIATKKDEQKAAKTMTVTYNGFADGNFVEVQKEDGSTEVMLVTDDALIQKLDQMEIGSKIKISYKAKAGQANKQIVKIL